MQEFMNAFRQTSYYRDLIEPDNVVGLFVGGSRAVGTAVEHSDYDLILLTTDGTYIDADKKHHLRWRGVKVHWYTVPLLGLLNFDSYDILRYCGLVPLRHFSQELAIYTNPAHEAELNALYAHRDKITMLGMYYFYRYAEQYVNEILTAGEILESHYSKKIYHLCLASYELTGDNKDVDFLRSIKRIYQQPVSDEYKDLAIERLQMLKEYADRYAELSNIDLEKLYTEIFGDGR